MKNEKSSKDFTFTRGDICWYNDPYWQDDTFVMHKTRPVIVVSSDSLNITSGTAIVVPLSTRTNKPTYPGQFDLILDGRRNRVHCDQIRVVDKRNLQTPIGKLPAPAMTLLNKNIAIITGTEKSYSKNLVSVNTKEYQLPYRYRGEAE